MIFPYFFMCFSGPFPSNKKFIILYVLGIDMNVYIEPLLLYLQFHGSAEVISAFIRGNRFWKSSFHTITLDKFLYHFFAANQKIFWKTTPKITVKLTPSRTRRVKKMTLIHWWKYQEVISYTACSEQ